MNSPIRLAQSTDWPAIWAILEPIYRAGETLCQPREITSDEARQHWLERPAKTYVYTRDNGAILGVYYLRANQPEPGSHVANGGYAVDPAARGMGVAAAMCQHSEETARAMGCRAMQFNFVISTNAGAVRLWQRQGFAIVGTLPGAFQHPRLGDVDVFVMFKRLVSNA